MFGTALTGSGSSTVAILYRGAGQAPNHGSTGFFSSHFIFYLEIRNGSMLRCLTSEKNSPELTSEKNCI
jgi:hypothetical protein